jgi:hypothetical protein
MSLVPEAINRVVARNALLAQRSSPGVLLGVGIVGMVGTTILACRATLKMEEVLDEAKEKLDMARTLEHVEYSEKDRKRDVSLIYFQSGVKIAKLYSPAIIVGVCSIAALTKSHQILTTRNTAIMAAYTALDRGFTEYRARVVDKYGSDQDRDFRYGTEQVEIVDPKTEKKKIVKRVDTSQEPSIYAKFFDRFSANWSKEPEYNLLFLKAQQNYANDILHARGHVLLNDVYDMLGIPRTQAGAIVGWVLSRDGTTDDFVSFGVFEGKTDKVRDFVNGREGEILLDFNVDGVIWDKIDKPVEGLSWQRNR